MPICEPSQQPYHFAVIYNNSSKLMLPTSISLIFIQVVIRNPSFSVPDILCTHQIIEDLSFRRIPPDSLHSSVFSIRFNIKI